MKGRVLLRYKKNTYPKEIPISRYRIVHTGANTQEGGAHVGFRYSLYLK